MIDSETYQRLLDTHGRRVANRAAVSQMPKDQRDWSLFYQCYGPESALPEKERCRTGVIDKFDPFGWHELYADHPYDERSPVYRLTNGLSAQWFEWLVSIHRVWGTWAIRFIKLSLLLHDGGESIEAIESIARDEGELVAEDGARFCAWYAGWRGWVAFADGLTEFEIAALRLTFEWLRGIHHEHPRHPEPGSQEAEMMCPSELPETDQEAK
ncbi:hypothetical protein [Burkholderia ubonensis]|uniref:hypothetical protein n=1 Tax=Burkholderia ubonensis TaxID=101571 RepID=UPI000753CF86|nr:hypothetical protein [Burkholderia ubonensis]KVW35344.1 hypothetical protein WK93_29545 [Burkholderia ubonensis]OJB24968.1 hypothetical protein BGV54_08070 [Burkholderia ubonensis]